MLIDKPFHCPDDVRSYALHRCERNGVEPELAFAVGRADMDMRQFVSFIRIEVEPERSNAEDGRHE